MLSIACASGEEPYSMAMAATAAGWQPDQIRIDALDRSPQAIALAREARYSPRALRGTCKPWALRWLRREGDHVVVDSRIVSTVKFVSGDILAPPQAILLRRYEVVFCRNLLVYLNEAARETLATIISRLLSPGGLLFVGHAELLEPLHQQFDFVPDSHTFAMRFRPAEVSSDKGQTSPSASPSAVEGVVARPATRAAEVGPDHQPPPETTIPPLPARETSPSQLGPADQARLLADEGHLSEALERIQSAMRTSATEAADFELLGSVQLGLGDIRAARDAFVKALYLDPNHEEVLLQLAIAYQRLGDEAMATRYRRRAAQAHQASLRKLGR
jgi:chemotaxis protein methyltransferase WspC